ncbi:MAG: histidine--tRNA ligase [Bacilli bacterium]
MNKPKGTYDVFGQYGKKLTHVNNIYQELMENYNYEFIRTPVFESSELFHRGMGESTDVVTKETYDFKDRGGRNITLKPEGTAGVVRSLIENKLYVDEFKKFFYFTPCFRYERPGSGRFREFYQFGCEVFGSKNPLVDAEVILIAYNFLSLIGINNYIVKINSLGTNEERKKYKEALIKYLNPHIDTLCDDCKDRINQNPLRILDCKIDDKKEVIKNAPNILEFLGKESLEHFNEVKSYLDLYEVNYEIDFTLVRGLDYYSHTIFEIVCLDESLGGASTLVGGGRYDSLVETLGGPSTPACGFGIGSERLLSLVDLDEELNGIDAYVVPVNKEDEEYALSIIEELRLTRFKIDLDYMNRSFKSKLKQADKLNSKFIIIVGEEERKNFKVKIKDTLLKEETTIEVASLLEYLSERSII